MAWRKHGEHQQRHQRISRWRRRSGGGGGGSEEGENRKSWPALKAASISVANAMRSGIESGSSISARSVSKSGASASARKSAWHQRMASARQQHQRKHRQYVYRGINSRRGIAGVMAAAKMAHRKIIINDVAAIWRRGESIEKMAAKNGGGIVAASESSIGGKAIENISGMTAAKSSIMA